MTQKQKIALVKAKQPNLSDKEARAQVKIIDWLTKYEQVLKVAHKNFMVETGEKVEFMRFAVTMYEDDPDFIKEYEKDLALNN
jgi:hypothetical protein